MSVFDLLFVLVFFVTLALFIAAVASAVGGRRSWAAKLFLGTIVLVGAYVGAVIVVSLASPRRVLAIGEQQCWDDWCIAVANVQRTAGDTSTTYEVTLRLSSRARVPSASWVYRFT